MKISLFGVSGVTLGKHNVRDPRLDQVDQLVEAKKKTYAQVDLVSGEEANEADAILVLKEGRPDLVLKDLEFVEMRLSRDPQPAEKALLDKLRSVLEAEQFIFNAGLDAAENQIIAAYTFLSNKPVTVAESAELEAVDRLLGRVLQESGQISFFTVGGKENRAWLIKKGTTAWEAAGVIHTDMQKGFIRAEIISFDDLVQAGGETGAKRAGKMRLELRDYLMQDCDIANFRFSK